MSAATQRAVYDMLQTFPNIQIGLRVGIGGGAPSPENDIRLGDIVVSIPSNGESGVVAYDIGKSIQGQSFQRTLSLNQPPRNLLGALTSLRTQYMIEGHRLEEAIGEVLAKTPRLRKEFARPEPESDLLYRSQVIHSEGDGSGCDITCGRDSNSLVFRAPRSEDEDDPVIHYGLIASVNTTMRDALIRDRLAKEMRILGFDKQATGLMNHFPCLMIQGICNYSDSHRNERWQGYAAMVAAAYAKDLLCHVAPKDTRALKSQSGENVDFKITVL
jgi:nucleoside phosphorylase